MEDELLNGFVPAISTEVCISLTDETPTVLKVDRAFKLQAAFRPSCNQPCVDCRSRQAHSLYSMSMPEQLKKRRNTQLGPLKSESSA